MPHIPILQEAQQNYWRYRRVNIKTILVVDNDEAITAFLKMYLEEKGYSVLTARDGLQALHMLETINPEVIFIDLIMPNIDGRKLAELLRKDTAYKTTNLVVLSAISPEEDFNFSQWGFDGCIAKGPLKTVGKNVLEILKQLEKTQHEPLHYKVLGIEHLFKREITQELLSIKKHFELILANMAESIIELSPDGTIIYTNPAAVILLETPEENLLASSFSQIYGGREEERIQTLLSRARGGEDVIREKPPLSLGEKKVAIELYTLSDKENSSIIVILNDITEQIAAENAIKRSNAELERRVTERTIELQNEVEEKEVILKEVHHRVKNNLAIISSLLTFSKRKTEGGQIFEILQEVQDRIKAISLIHEKLYQSDSFTKISFKDYIVEIAGYLRSSLKVPESEITINVRSRDIQLEMDKAIPCAIIVNELISNAFKHAFPESRKGTIGISFTTEDGKLYKLEVTDDGVAFPSTFQFENPDTTGFKIIHTLARQLGGTVNVEKSPQKTFTITFPL